MSRNLLVLLVLAGCIPEPPRHPSRTTQVRSSFAARFRATDAAFNRELWSPACSDGADPDRCGLLWARMLTNGDVIDYIRAVCKEDPRGTVSDDCLDGLKAEYTVGIRRRYPRATAADIASRCQRDGVELCETDANFLELEWIASHDNAVEEARATVRNELDDAMSAALSFATKQERAEARAIAEEQSEQARRILGALGAGLSAAGASLSASSRGIKGVTSETPWPLGCSSDYECGGGGHLCSKPPGSARGRCVQNLNSAGLEKFTPPRPGSFGMGKADCTPGGGCPSGFTCTEGHCMK